MAPAEGPLWGFHGVEQRAQSAHNRGMFRFPPRAAARAVHRAFGSPEARLGLSVVAASWLAVFSLFGVRASFAILKDPIARELGWSQGQVTLGYSLMMVFYAVTAFFSGTLLDRRGPRPVYLVATILGSIGLFATAAVSRYMLYLAFFGILAGACTGMLWVTSTVSVRKWYVGPRYAGMWGVAFMGAPVAQFTLAFLMGRLVVVHDPASWRTGMAALGAIVTAALLGAFFLAKHSPERYGFSAIGSSAVETASHDAKTWKLREAFTVYAVWGVILAFLANMMGEFLIWTQVVSYWTGDLGWSQARAVSVYGVIGLVGIVSMPTMGRVADRMVRACGDEAIGRKRILLVGSALGIAACALLLQSRHGVGFAIAACVLFAFYWAIVPGGVVGYTGAVYGRASLGRIWGLATLIVMGIGPFSGSFLGGLFKDISGSYTVSLLFALSAFVVAFGMTLTLPRRAEHRSGGR